MTTKSWWSLDFVSDPDSLRGVSLWREGFVRKDREGGIEGRLKLSGTFAWLLFGGGW